MNLHNSNVVFQSTAHTSKNPPSDTFILNELQVMFRAIQEEVLLMKCHNSLFGKCTLFGSIIFWSIEILSARNFIPFIGPQWICMIIEHQCKMLRLDRSFYCLILGDQLQNLTFIGDALAVQVSVNKLDSSSAGNI